jgi:branched-chain amino acid aminotransferase
MADVRVWVDGALVDPEAPAIRPLDHGLTVGDGAFETCKVVDGAPFALTRHLRRLDTTLAGLGLPAADGPRIRAGIEAVLGAGEPVSFGRLRITVTAGLGPPGSDRPGPEVGGPRPTHVVTVAPSRPRQPDCALVTVPWTRNERAATAGLKTTSYADNVLALAHARARGGDEAVFANTRGELCEGTGSNLFVVVGGVLHTPPLESGCLAGITRELTLEWCRAAGVEVREVALPVDVLVSAEEVLLTSSTRDVQPARTVDGRALPAPGPVTAHVAAVFAARAREGMDP